jgi:PAS domain S-box-containing protein
MLRQPGHNVIANQLEGAVVTQPLQHDAAARGDRDLEPRTHGHPDSAEWQAVLDAVPGYLIIADRGRRIRLLSRPPLGTGLDEFIGQDLARFVAEDQREMVLQAVADVLSGEPVVEQQARSARTGRWFRSRTVGIRDEGGVVGLVTHVIDIDDAMCDRAALARLRAQASAAAIPEGAAEEARIMGRFGGIVDSLPFLIAYVDSDRRYRFNSAAYERWFGIPREALRGRHVSEVLGAAYPRLQPLIDEVLQGHIVDREIDMPYRGGTIRRVLTHLRPDLADSGEVLGFYVWVQDLTERRRAEAALRQREDELRLIQKLEALGRLSSGIAHEFNNLLQSVISGCTALLDALDGREPKAADWAARMRRAAFRGASLTRQLLSFSRQDETDRAPLNIDELLADTALLLGRLLGPEYALDVDLHAGCRVLANDGEIQQVLFNLVLNARDAMPEGGRLRIATQSLEVSAEDSTAHVGLAAGHHVLLTISDTGTGMDDQTRKRMFDPFFTTKAADRGTGLGLATVYGIVQRLRGHIDVDSAPGQGTTFRLYLPCQR